MSDSNWDAILTEYEQHFDSSYEYDFDQQIYIFAGIMHSSDDYYYCMIQEGTGKLVSASCVGTLEQHGFKKVWTT